MRNQCIKLKDNEIYFSTVPFGIITFLRRNADRFVKIINLERSQIFENIYTLSKETK